MPIAIFSMLKGSVRPSRFFILVIMFLILRKLFSSQVSLYPQDIVEFHAAVSIIGRKTRTCQVEKTAGEKWRAGKRGRRVHQKIGDKIIGFSPCRRTAFHGIKSRGCPSPADKWKCFPLFPPLSPGPFSTFPLPRAAISHGGLRKDPPKFSGGFCGIYL